MPAGFLVWDSLSPWQLVQVGVRVSEITPCRVLPMDRISGLLWQRVHFASPRRTRSLCGAFSGSCAMAPCKVMPIARPAAKLLTTAARRHFRLVIVCPLPRRSQRYSVRRTTVCGTRLACFGSRDDICVGTRLFDLDQI